MKNTRFQSKYSEHDAFYLRADLLRPQFGLWDSADPVAHTLLDLVAAQNELADLFSEVVTKPRTSERLVAGEFNDLPGEQAMFRAAVQKRHVAGERLMEALRDRQSWPDPKMGQR